MSKSHLAGTYLTGVLILTTAAAPGALAQNSAAEAISLVEQYIMTHNTHRPAEALAYYARDAEFHLSVGRGVVSGIDAIARLEHFDAAAGSTLYPQNLTAVFVDGQWHIGFDHVIEYSDVFSAMGLNIVFAQGLSTGFILKDGAIQVLYQPDLTSDCMAVMASGFGGLRQWLANESEEADAATLLRDGNLVLTAETAPALLAAARTWRAQSGWGPTPEQAMACARTPPAGP